MPKLRPPHRRCHFREDWHCQQGEWGHHRQGVHLPERTPGRRSWVDPKRSLGHLSGEVFPLASTWPISPSLPPSKSPRPCPLLFLCTGPRDQREGPAGATIAGTGRTCRIHASGDLPRLPEQKRRHLCSAATHLLAGRIHRCSSMPPAGTSPRTTPLSSH